MILLFDIILIWWGEGYPMGERVFSYLFYRINDMSRADTIITIYLPTGGAPDCSRRFVGKDGPRVAIVAEFEGYTRGMRVAYYLAQTLSELEENWLGPLIFIRAWIRLLRTRAKALAFFADLNRMFPGVEWPSPELVAHALVKDVQHAEYSNGSSRG